MTGQSAWQLDETCGGLLGIIAVREQEPSLSDDAGRTPLSRSKLRQNALDVAGQIAGGKKLAFLFAHNDAATVVALLAIAAAGHVVALVDPALAQEKIAHLMTAYVPDLLVESHAREHDFAKTAGGDDWTIGLQDGIQWAARKAASPQVEIASELFVLLSTSGTTGSAKFVRLSYDAVTSNARQIAKSLHIATSDVGIGHLPLHYSYGMSIVTSHLFAGAQVFVMDDAITSPSFWPKVAKAGGTHFPGVPFHYTVLARLGFDHVPGHVRSFTQAGGALDPRIQTRLLDRVVARSADFYVMYGQTEAAPRMATLPPERLSDKLGSVGIALEGATLSIVGEDGQRCPPDTVGSVIFEGPNVMLGYAENRVDLAKGDEAGGRLETGDLGRLDADGYLFLTGRTKRFAKVAGLRLGLDEIEAEFAGITQTACFESAEKIIVCHELDADDQLKARVKELALSYKIPAASFGMRRVDVIPRKGSGKIDYARLKEVVNV